MIFSWALIHQSSDPRWVSRLDLSSLLHWYQSFRASDSEKKKKKSMAKVNLSPEIVREMLSIIREARNDLKKLDDSASASMISSHQMLASKASGGREISGNFENPLGNFVEHMVGQKQQEVNVVKNSKIEWFHDGFGRQAPFFTSSVTSPLPKKPPGPPDMVHGKGRTKGNIPVKYSCEEIYNRMSNGLCIFCEDFDTPGHHDLKHKGVKILVSEGDEEEPIVTEDDREPIVEESFVDSNSVTETVMKLHSFSESLKGLTSDLQIVNTTGQRKLKTEVMQKKT